MRTRESGHAPGRTAGWLLLSLVLSAALPAALLVVLGRRSLDFSAVLVSILLGAVALDALLILVTGILSLRPVRLPPAPHHPYPPASASWAARLAAVDLSGIGVPLVPPTAQLAEDMQSNAMFLTTELAFKTSAGPVPRARRARDTRLCIWQSVPGSPAEMWRRWVAMDRADLAVSGFRRFGPRAMSLYRIGWLPAVVWLTPSVPAAAGYAIAQLDVLHHAHWSGALAQVIALLALYAVVPGVLRSVFAYLLADDELRHHRSWFLVYGLTWMTGLGAMRNSALRVVELRAALGPRAEREPPGTRDDHETIAPSAGVSRAETSEHVLGDVVTARAAEPKPALSPAAQSVVAAADRLPDVMATLLRELDAGAHECRRLAIRIKDLERAAGEPDDVLATARVYASNTIEPEDLRRLQETIAWLRAHPEDVRSLVALARRADALGRVVDGYARLQATVLPE